MKKISFSVALILIGVVCSFGQIPERFNYQGVLRNSSNELIANTNINIQISLLEGSETATASYTEQHVVQTNAYGQFIIQVGAGTVTSGTFSSVDWSASPIYLKTEVDQSGGTTFTEMDVVELVTVPFALYAKNVENNDDADADPANELQTLQFLGDTLKISDGNQIVFNYDSTNWAINGDKLYYNEGNVGIGSSNPVSNLEVKANTSGTDALFQVINADNDTVFAVYPDGVKVFVDPTAKGKVGGFAVSGRNPSKAGEVDIMKVTLDSTRIYVNDDSAIKGKVGGFAVSGRNPSKGTVNDYLQVTRDSTRVIVSESTTKGKVGGFAVSGRNPSKGGETDYFNISGNLTADVIDNESRIMWYPQKAAFLAGEVHIGSADSVGTNSTSIGYRNIAKGDYSQAMGYNSKSLGVNSMAIGNNALAVGNESYAIGNYATSQDSGSYAIGTGALAEGLRSFAFGSTGVDSSGVATSPTKALGDYSYALGMGSVALNKGAFAIGTQDTTSGNYSTTIGYRCKSGNWAGTAIGYESSVAGNGATALGFKCNAEGIYSTAIGYKSSTSTGWWSVAIGNVTTATGYTAVSIGRSNTASGNISTAIGYNNNSSNAGSVAFGSNNISSGEYSLALGYTTNATGNYSISLGSECNSSALHTITLGSGSVADYLYGIAIGYEDTASGSYALATGRGTLSSGVASFSTGDNTKASGQAAFSAGYKSLASGFASIAAGSQSTASGSYSFATGYKTNASTFGTATFGYQSVASGRYSVAAGYETEAQSYSSFVLGRYNVKAGTADSWLSTDPLFVIGNGSGDASRSNAVTVLKNGNTGIGTSAPGSYRLYVDGGNAYFSNDVSALSFTDRTPYPKDLKTAYDAVLSMKRLPDGEYDEDNKENQLDHSTLHPFIISSDGKHRDLSATVSAQNEVIKDLIIQTENLKKENAELKQKLNEIIVLLKND